MVSKLHLLSIVQFCVVQLLGTWNTPVGSVFARVTAMFYPGSNWAPILLIAGRYNNLMMPIICSNSALHCCRRIS